MVELCEEQPIPHLAPDAPSLALDLICSFASAPEAEG